MIIYIVLFLTTLILSIDNNKFSFIHQFQTLPLKQYTINISNEFLVFLFLAQAKTINKVATTLSLLKVYKVFMWLNFFIQHSCNAYIINSYFRFVMY